ncbi:MAG: hypothetical protein ACREM1_04090, partial [Longimicrobiales bacterium]
MPATTRTHRNGSPRFTTPVPTPHRFLRCVACGTRKKERNYALCSECYKLNGTLDRALFTCFARHTERETTEYSYRTHPEFAKACRIYARRDRKARALAAIDARVPKNWRPHVDPRDRHEDEPYDGLGPYELADLLDWQMGRAQLPAPEESEHGRLSDAEIARWDARVNAWARR